jgi:phosphoribosyl 1,2-cyclic phosphodiesterase
MKLTFLGSGGGRFATISQKRMTGGLRIDDIGTKNFHVDPGPGALVRSHQFGVNPTSLDGVFVSHAHTDHYSDAEILIEAMTRGMTQENGIIVGSRSVFEGYQQWGPCISKYHRSKSDNLILGPNKTKKVDDLIIKGTKTIHGDPTGVGFQIKTKNLTFSYTSDTKYFENLCKYHKGADIIVGNILRPGSKSIKGHLCSENFLDLIEQIKPKLAIMAHFGFKMISANPNKEAKFIKEKTGINTLSAFDGLRVEINDKSPEIFKVSSLKNSQDTNKKNNNNNLIVDDSEQKTLTGEKEIKTYTRDLSMNKL